MKKYKQAGRILEKIQKADNILLSLHISPDPDSVGSNLAMYYALKQLGKKKIEVISPDPPQDKLNFAPGFEKIKHEDITQKDLSSFDLFLSIDQTPVLMTRKRQLPVFPENLSMVIIDHHANIKGLEMGDLVLSDSSLGSTGELLYNLFSQWKVRFNKEIATNLLIGIVGDTGAFRFPNTTAETLQAASALMDRGAPLSEIASNLFFKNKFRVVKFWGRVIATMQLEEVGGRTLAWSALPHSVVKELGISAREGAASVILQTIEESDFGLIMVEEEEGVIRGSFRSRSEIDVSKIAGYLGGGGHPKASGFKVTFEKGGFEDAVKEVLAKIDNFLKEK